MGDVKLHSRLTEKEWTVVVAGLQKQRDVYTQLGSTSNADYVQEIIYKVWDIKEAMQGSMQ